MAPQLNNDDEFNLNLDDSDKDSTGGMEKIKEGFSLKIALIAGGILLVIAIIVVAVFLFSGKEDALPEDILAEDASLEDPASFQAFVAFDDIVQLEEIELILSDMGGDKTLTVGISLKIDQQELRDEIFREDQRVKNTILSLLKTKTLAELSGVEGKILLSHEITRLLNDVLSDGYVINLYFYKFLIM